MAPSGRHGSRLSAGRLGPSYAPDEKSAVVNIGAAGELPLPESYSIAAFPSLRNHRWQKTKQILYTACCCVASIQPDTFALPSPAPGASLDGNLR